MLLKKNAYKLITFDAMNTLIHFKEPVGVAYSKVAKVSGLGDIDPTILEKSFFVAYKRYTKEHPCFGQSRDAPSNQLMSHKQWWTDVVKLTFADACPQLVLEVKEEASVVSSSSSSSSTSSTTKKSIIFSNSEILHKTAEFLYHYFATLDPWTLDPHARDLFRYLTEKKYQLGILSNYDSRLRKILDAYELSQYFSFIALSGEIGYEKPNKKIFEKAQDLASSSGSSSFEMTKTAALQEEQQNCLHIGDHIGKDYVGARGAGWHCFLIDVKNGNAMDPRIEDRKHTLDNLGQLKDIL